MSLSVLKSASPRLPHDVSDNTWMLHEAVVKISQWEFLLSLYLLLFTTNPDQLKRHHFIGGCQILLILLKQIGLCNFDLFAKLKIPKKGVEGR